MPVADTIMGMGSVKKTGYHTRTPTGNLGLILNGRKRHNDGKAEIPHPPT